MSAQHGHFSVATTAHGHAPMAVAPPAGRALPSFSHNPAAQRVQVPHAATADDSDEEDDMDEARELAEAARQAAKLCRSPSQRHQLQNVQLRNGWHLPEAVASITAQGVSAMEAEEALLATVDEATNWEEWLNNALFWIADKHEKDAEAAQLREAMQVSLQAAEQERAAAAALHDLPAAKLRERFGHCVLLRKLQRACSSDVLFQSPLKGPLLAMLDLEHKCVHRWYQRSGAAAYFSAIADACLAQVHSIAGLSSTGRPSPEPEPSEQAACTAEPKLRRSARSRSCSRASSVGPDEGTQGPRRPAKRPRTGKSTEPGGLAAVPEAAAAASVRATAAAVTAAASATTASAAAAAAVAPAATVAGQEAPGTSSAAQEAGGTTHAAIAPPAVDGVLVAAADHPAVASLVVSLSAKAKEIQDAIAVMPEVCGQVPELFRAATPVEGDEDADEDGSFCVVLEGEEAEEALARHRQKQAAAAAAAAAAAVAAATAAATTAAAAPTAPAAGVQQTAAGLASLHTGPSSLATGQINLQQLLQQQQQQHWQQQQANGSYPPMQHQQQAPPFNAHQHALLQQMLQQHGLPPTQQQHQQLSFQQLQHRLQPLQQQQQQQPQPLQQPPRPGKPSADPAPRPKRGRGYPKGSRTQSRPSSQQQQAEQEPEVIWLLD